LHLHEGEIILSHFGHDLGESIDQFATQGAFDVVEGNAGIGSGELFEEVFKVQDAEVIGSESAELHLPKFAVRDGYRAGGSPFVVGKLTGIEIVNVNFERRLEAMLPGPEGSQDGHVTGS
jgi:hypothetical protein